MNCIKRYIDIIVLNLFFILMLKSSFAYFSIYNTLLFSLIVFLHLYFMYKMKDPVALFYENKFMLRYSYFCEMLIYMCFMTLSLYHIYQHFIYLNYNIYYFYILITLFLILMSMEYIYISLFIILYLFFVIYYSKFQLGHIVLFNIYSGKEFLFFLMIPFLYHSDTSLNLKKTALLVLITLFTEIFCLVSFDPVFIFLFDLSLSIYVFCLSFYQFNSISRNKMIYVLSIVIIFVLLFAIMNSFISTYLVSFYLFFFLSYYKSLFIMPSIMYLIIKFKASDYIYFISSLVISVLYLIVYIMNWNYFLYLLPLFSIVIIFILYLFIDTKNAFYLAESK